MAITTESNLQLVFNSVTSGEKLEILFGNKADYESTRTALLRKFKRYVDLLDNLGGANPFVGKFLKCSWNGEESVGRFEVADDRRRSNQPGGKILQILSDVLDKDTDDVNKKSLQGVGRLQERLSPLH